MAIMTHSQPDHAASGGVPVDAASFSALMAPFAPFGENPRLMVAVSGGADSMALAILAARWCADRNGKLIAVTVDHGLRADAATEAQWVSQQLATYGIEHITRRWTGPKPGAAIQQEARAARYCLIDDLAGELGILHVLVAHHFNDQAETVAMRRDHNSGPLGQAGMSAQRYLRHCRVLRPLLPVTSNDLRATLQAIVGGGNTPFVADAAPDANSGSHIAHGGQDWIEDPSNHNPAFERVRMRRKLQSGGGLLPADFSAMAHQRQNMEQAIGGFLARHVFIATDGVATVTWPFVGSGDIKAGRHADDPDIGSPAFDRAAYGIGHVLRMIGGGNYAPARDSVRHVLQLFRQNSATRHSLAGCVLHRRENHILIYREAGRMDIAPQPVLPRQVTRWDNRFELCLEWPQKPGASGDMTGFAIVPLGVCDPFHKRVFRKAMAQTVPFWASRPRPALAVLPLLLWQDQPLSVAGLEIYALSDVLSAAGCPTGYLDLFRAIKVTWRFAPSAPLWEGGFKFVANP
ncbi:tRNA lysidine(34) synthetase TilS [Thalassospira mesophila]|uniref:tRNA lysidine(34) synthetase TilS n=1 Tax=Thalassospira mesophila TaxID=1293891 RepID=UPI0013028C12|nr:tRNA lysidine(34) synthetase TilS [Thalassospira mesophila]